jgi:hypothetical protein
MWATEELMLYFFSRACALRCRGMRPALQIVKIMLGVILRPLIVKAFGRCRSPGGLRMSSR